MAKKNSNSKIAAQINQADPLELVIIAYNAAIESLQNAKKFLKSKETKKAKESILKTKKIIAELKKSLDLDITEVSSNLVALYNMMDDLLDSALKNKDSAIVEQVTKMLIEIREAWQVILKQKKQNII